MQRRAKINTRITRIWQPFMYSHAMQQSKECQKIQKNYRRHMKMKLQGKKKNIYIYIYKTTRHDMTTLFFNKT